MAKIRARGAYEIASVICDRHLAAGEAYTGSPAETFRQKFVLRSDGAILRKLVWVQPDGGERRAHSSAYSLWTNRKIKADLRSRETLLAMLVRHGYTEVTAEAQTLERKATAQAAADKRKANQGPDGSATQWAELHDAAHAAGMAAGEASVPVPMIVQEHANPLDDSSPVVQSYGPIMDGSCGSAYVTIRPANGSFARWLKANRGGFPAHGGGLMLSVHAFGSVTRKFAYAQAFAGVLREAGVSAYPSTWEN